MRRIVAIHGLLLGAAALLSAQQQPPTPVMIAPGEDTPTPVKIATIFGQNAIVATQEGQKASAVLNAKFAPRKEEFDRKQAELQQLRDQLKKNQATMNADAKARLNQAIDDRNKQLQRLSEDSQNALKEDEGAMLQELGDKLLAVVRDYAARNSYAVVLDVSDSGGPILWASPSVDITNEIVKLYDQAHPVAAAPALAPPPKK